MINLSKGTQAPLSSTVTKVSATAMWESSTGGAKGLLGKIRKNLQGLDLDLLAAARDSQGRVVSMIGGPEGASALGAMTHSGDSRGRGAGVQSETVELNLATMPGDIGSVVLILDAFKTGVSLGDARNVAIEIIADGAPFATFRVPMDERMDALVLAKLVRTSGGWSVQAIGSTGNGRTTQQIISLAQSA